MYQACFPEAIAVGSATADDTMSEFSGAGAALDALLAPGSQSCRRPAAEAWWSWAAPWAATAHASGASSSPALVEPRRLGREGDPVRARDDRRPNPRPPRRDLCRQRMPRIQLDRALATLPAGEALDPRQRRRRLPHLGRRLGSFAVRARARCSGRPDTFSDSSDPLGMEVAVRDQLGTPRLSGPDSGWWNAPITVLATGSGPRRSPLPVCLRLRRRPRERARG